MSAISQALFSAGAEVRQRGLARNAAAGAGGAVAGMALTALSYRVYLQHLGYEQYGIWVLLSIVLNVASLGAFGFGPALTKLVAEAWARGDRDQVWRYVSTAVWSTLSAGAVLVSLAALAAWLSTSSAVHPDALRLLPWMALLSLYTVIVDLLASALAGLDRLDLSAAGGVLSQAAGLVVAAVLLQADCGLWSLLAGSFAAAALLHCFCLRAVRATCGERLLVTAADAASWHGLLRIGGPIFSGSLVSLALIPLNKLLLAASAGPAAAALFDVAIVSGLRLRSLFEQAMRALAPRVSSLQARHADARPLVWKSTALCAALGLPFFAALAWFAPVLLDAWLPAGQAAAAVPPFRLALLAVSASLLGLPAYYGLLGAGRSMTLFLSYLWQALVSLSILGVAAALGRSIDPSLALLAMLGGMVASSLLLAWRASTDAGLLRLIYGLFKAGHRGVMSALVRLYLRAKGAEYGSGLRCISLPLIRRHPEAAIRIGSNVTLLNRPIENVGGIAHPTTLAALEPGAELIIGDHTGISGAAICAAKRVEIGRFVLIGVGARIYDTDFHPLDHLARRRNDASQVACAPVVIEDDVWVGAAATILKGVRVGARSVIAAGAVVTRDVPPDSIAAGVPARVRPLPLETKR